MADLFDMNVGGYGFHLTSHLLALIALFVACFAITGYITFRNTSVPRTALQPGVFDEGVLDSQGGVYTYRKIVNLAAHPTNDVAAVVPIVLKSGTIILRYSMMMLEAGTGANAAATVDLYTHTAKLAAGDVGNTGNNARLVHNSGMIVDTKGAGVQPETPPLSIAAGLTVAKEYMHLVYGDNTAAAMTATPKCLVEMLLSEAPESFE